MTIIAHNSLCSTRAYHLRIDLAHDATFGNRCMENQKKIYAQAMIYPWRCIAMTGRVCLRTLVDRKRMRLFNAVDVVVLIAIRS